MSTKNEKAYTPMIQQYLKIKEDYADALVFFRLGDFYEMFFDDAIIASKELEITLTSRDAGDKIPMAGVPHHSAKPYIQKLIERGYKVALAEQVTEPGKGLVEREVIRLITPGTIFEDEMLVSKNNNYIASLILKELGYLLTYVDISTGESFLMDNLNKKVAINHVKSLKIREIVLANESDPLLIEDLKNNQIYVTIHQNYNNHDTKWSNHLNNDQKIGPRHLLNYLNTTQMQPLSHLRPIEVVENKDYLNIDYQVKRHLEILESNTNNPKTTLLYHIDNTKTPMGARLLKHELNYPVKNGNILNYRYNLIDAFSNVLYRDELIDYLNQVYDINRIVGKISFKSVNPRDLIQLKLTLKVLNPLKNVLNKYEDELISELANQIDEHDSLFKLLDESLIEEAPILIKEGGLIKDNYNKELDELRDINLNSKKWLDEFEEQEKERLGVKNLKVGYNRVFGYFIEISKAQSMMLGENHGYERKQTLTNSERYTSEVLKSKEDLILNAKEKAINLEYELFVEIRTRTEQYLSSLQELSQVISQIDLYLSHAITAEKNRYKRPVINTITKEVEVIKGRHPVVEKFTPFVANDVLMNESEVFLITGPNMSGKSTYMRMYALIVYMMQIGSFVPADKATIPLYDAIFTRIGASDDLSAGKSTFMVEMVESNEAIQNATENSLILFDEIGRGTATYDGMALAQGIVEYIATKIKAQTLFATHYHELTELSNSYKNIINLHVKAKEENNKMVFLHQVEKSASDRSYGIQVAALANLPKDLLKRSKTILESLEKNKKEIKVDLFNYQDEVSLAESINPNEEEVLNDLENIDINKLTPIEALIFLQNLQNKIKK